MLLLPQVRVQARDGGTPSLSSPEVTVTVNVIRNLNCPVFSNLPTSVVTINQNRQIINIYNVTATDNDQQVIYKLLFFSFSFFLIFDSTT